MFRPRRRTVVLLVACALLPPLTAASCGGEPSGVALGTAARGTVAEIVEASGSVTARAAATVSSPAAGTLAELRFDAGDKVTKGQVVAVIDSPAAARRLQDAARAVDAASAGGVPAGGTAGFRAVQRRTDARADKAFAAARDAAGEVTDAELRAALLTQVKAARQQYQAASEAAGAAVRSVQRGVASLGQAVNALSAAQRLQAKQAYDLAEAAVDALTLRAPVSGVVQLGGTASGGTASLSDLLAGPAGATTGAAPAQAPLSGVDSAVPVGAVVGAGTPILTIVDTGRLGLAAEVDETDVLLVEPGGTATAELDAATGASYEATVRAVDLLPTTSARGGVSYRVRLTLGKGSYADGRVAPTPRPGMSAIVRLRVREAADAVTVPASSIVSSGGRDTVWAVRGGRAERVPVTLGVQGEDVVQVVSGIDAGQQVVVGGADQVSAGQTVP
ncbi:efflux RND transporter periplasmic adaptor subunit [Amorphoplanes digitatis]|uniref:Multidrug efflux pump subunit AcrA (Membrane-fusion protein) n=1 Tax=Actinoplanes digitatis TaxID=1868 RepID=A0A7W7MQ72_9ACTN|nr:HlyD family efflux transporter periplasmic adaptor subunit [Actinoplanes digitatis]MBB4762442.1 multidrug efflux pump subunit AcrA (membrane-fusion protein) [Actinoplanes digitatis]